MKEFYKTLLKNVFAITGVRELEFMTTEEVDLRVNALVFKSRQFDYIPKEVQQKTIKENLMSVDSDFRGLTPAVVHGWLRGIADHWWSKKQGAEIPDVEVHDVSEETMHKVDEYVKSLSNAMQSVPSVSGEEIDQIRKEDARRLEGKRVMPVYRPKPVDERQEKIRSYVIANVAKWKTVTPKHFFEIEGVRVPGDTQEEAQEIYLNAVL